MDHASADGSGLLRLTGVMGICVGLAWAFQIVGFGAEASAFARFLWVMAAASVAGAGAGLVMSTWLMHESAAREVERVCSEA